MSDQLPTTNALKDKPLVNPRRLQLPTENELERGIGRAQFRGVVYRRDREGTRPWVARYLDRPLGNYKTALDAAIARWICSHHNCDLVKGDDGKWYGQTYQGKEDGDLAITRFTGASEVDVMRQIEEHLFGKKSTNVDSCQNVEDQPINVLALILPPANPRQDSALPAELPRTAGRGQYRGVVLSKGRYTARWNNTLHLGTYDTANEAGLAVYIAEHYDRDVEKDGDHNGYKGRAYKKPLNGRPSMQHFRADTEAELTRLIDEYHGIVGRTQQSTASEKITITSTDNVKLGEAVQRFWQELWLIYSHNDGQAVCAELYLMWQLYLARQGLSHLVHLKRTQWCGAVDNILGLQRFNLPYEPQMQALTIPDECRLRTQQTTKRVLWMEQWKMVMTDMCSADVCVAVWIRRREASKRRDVHFRQQIIRDEIEGRKLLKLRCPEWVDDWVRPALLDHDDVYASSKQELANVDTKVLQWWLKLAPDNSMFSRELNKRMQ